MKRIVYIFLLLLIGFNASAQTAGSKSKGSRSYVIGFYNLENLFDIYDDPAKNDEEFLPDGKNKWTEAKYNKKLHNMATVIKAMADANGRYHTVLGVSEIENRLVLEDLVSQPEIADANYQIIHYDGPDRRGVDVGLLYKPEQFTYLDSESIPFTFEDSEIEFSMDKEAQDYFRTRDILMVHGLIDGEHFAFYVAHLPSRIGGKGGDLRSRGGEIIYRHAMEMMKKYPGIKIAAMGDMNDNPTDDSMAVYLHGKEKPAEVTETDFFSPFLSMYKAGYGSLAYRGEWSIYDLILVNNNLVNAPDGSLKIRPVGKKGHYGVVFKRPFMTNQKGQYKGTPFRTFSGGAFIGGYSDHYPTFIVVSK
ncbi:MAG: endonuclease/exonuclease/phosphatase family protein [Bacteroidales bacterium]|nr:endonuclease/exonuclease/phosphatase family protein [Bacteroidales bacterium]